MRRRHFAHTVSHMVWWSCSTGFATTTTAQDRQRRWWCDASTSWVIPICRVVVLLRLVFYVFRWHCPHHADPFAPMESRPAGRPDVRRVVSVATSTAAMRFTVHQICKTFLEIYMYTQKTHHQKSNQFANASATTTLFSFRDDARIWITLRDAWCSRTERLMLANWTGADQLWRTCSKQQTEQNFEYALRDDHGDCFQKGKVYFKRDGEVKQNRHKVCNAVFTDSTRMRSFFVCGEIKCTV